MNMRTINSNVGFGFPFGFAAGRVRTHGGSAHERPTIQDMDDAVSSGVRQISLTERGERVMQPNIGVGAARYLFSPMGSRLTGILVVELRNQVELYCPRCRLDVQAAKVDSAQGRVEVHAHLIHNSETMPYTPFFLGVQR